MPRFTVAPEIFAAFPTYCVAGVVVTGFDNARVFPEITTLLAAANADAGQRLRGVDPKSLSEIAVWRAAFQRLGITASTYQSSVEAMVRRVAKGNPIPNISPIVDLGNAVSLRHLVPVGAHDVARWAEATLIVRLAMADDIFRPVGNEDAEMPESAEVVYATGTRVQTRRWVWRQSRDALIGLETRDVWYPIDAFVGATDEAAGNAQKDLARVARACGLHARTFLVNAASPAAEW